MKGYCKRESDGRSRRPEVAEALRIRGAQAVADGEHYVNVANAMGVNPRSVLRWVAKYGLGGVDALKTKPFPGAKPSLDVHQMADLARMITDGDPRQYSFEFGLWTLNRVRSLIQRKFGVEFTVAWVGRLLDRLGLTPQRPSVRASEQDVVWVQKWREIEFPALKARAKQEGARIYFGDESGVRSDQTQGRTWGRMGKTPEIVAPGARFSLNLISAVCGNGELEFMPVDGSVNGAVFCLFLERLIAGKDHKVILVLDNVSYHRSRPVMDFVAANSERLELVFLPTYAPKLNPDEQVWAHVKHEVRAVVPQTKAEFRQTIIRALWKLQANLEKVKSFFRHPDTAYAAAM